VKLPEAGGCTPAGVVTQVLLWADDIRTQCQACSQVQLVLFKVPVLRSSLGFTKQRFLCSVPCRLVVLCASYKSPV
jgi:hypothetical protein